MAACTSANYDEQETAKRSSLLRCPNKQYTAPFWLKVKHLFIGKDTKKNIKCDEQKKIHPQKEIEERKKFCPLKAKSRKTYSNYSFGKICGIFVLATIFSFSTVACIIMWFTDLYSRQILEVMTIHDGSFMLDSWKKPPLKPLICVYAFNYTNLDDFVDLRAKKLQVKEVGPYCYRETLEKINVHFNETEGTVTYGNRRKHEFEPFISKGSLNDTLVLPNPALIAAITKISELNIFMRMAASIILRAEKSKVILRVRAHDFFFGYDEEVLRMVQKIGKVLSIEIPFKKFGILAIRATETDETLTVKTGKNDLEHIDVVTAVNGEKNLSVWYGDECNRVDGSDGAFFPRKDINQSTTLYLFHADICRRLPLIYDKDVDFQEGIIAMRFHMPPWVYDTKNTCYCEKNCPPKGLFDLTRCAKGIPFLMSFPHFLHGDPSLTNDIGGLHPDINLHDFYIDIQPHLGFTLGLVSRLQINMQIVKARGISYLNAFKDKTILPIVWIEVSADNLPQDLFRVIYHATITVKNAQLCLKWGTLATAIITALCIINSLYRIPRKHKLKITPQKQKVELEPKNSKLSNQNNHQPNKIYPVLPVTISDTHL